MSNTPPDKLTPRQKRFVQEYMKDLNASQAYLRAGYKDSAVTHSYHIMNLPKIKAEIERMQKELRAEHATLLERNIKELTKIAYASMDDVVDMSTGLPVLKPDHDGKLLESISEYKGGVKFKLHSKLQAIDILNKMLGAYVTQMDVTSNGQSLSAPATIVYEVIQDVGDINADNA